MKKEQLITIDINRLDTDQLEALAEMLYGQNRMQECDAVNERIAFCNDWMTPEQSKAYYETYCE